MGQRPPPVGCGGGGMIECSMERETFIWEGKKMTGGVGQGPRCENL